MSLLIGLEFIVWHEVKKFRWAMFIVKKIEELQLLDIECSSTMDEVPIK